MLSAMSVVTDFLLHGSADKDERTYGLAMHQTREQLCS